MKTLLQGTIAMSIAQFLAFILGFAKGQVDPNCSYYQKMDQVRTYYLYNDEYPSYFYGKRNCRWDAVVPANYVIFVNCSVELPATTKCAGDKLLISLEGASKQGAKAICGKTNVLFTSIKTRVSVFLRAQKGGGRYLCALKAVSASTRSVSACDCGWKNTRRIVGGYETRANEYPMMAGLVDFKTRELYCGATIINTFYVVTAAHCVYRKQPTSIGLIVGEHNVTTGADTKATKIMIIARITEHPNFNLNMYKNDVAVVRTRRPIVFNTLIGPVCLPFRYYNETFADNSVTMLGWGLTSYTGLKSTTLRAINVKALNGATCQSTNPGTTDNQFCTYEAGKDACQFDSGGPVLWEDPSTLRIHLIGIISFGRACGSSVPSVNTRVSSYLNWILSVSRDGTFCVK